MLKIWFINGVDNVNWPPYRDWKADVSSVSPSSEQIDLLWRRANARNVSFSISVRWSIYIINSVDRPNFRVSLPHRRSTTVSLETNPLYFLNVACHVYTFFFPRVSWGYCMLLYWGRFEIQKKILHLIAIFDVVSAANSQRSAFPS